MRPVGIGETLSRDIAKLVMRTTGDQSNTACGILQLCVGLEAVIEGVTNTVLQSRQERNAPDPGGGVDK